MTDFRTWLLDQRTDRHIDQGLDSADLIARLTRRYAWQTPDEMHRCVHAMGFDAFCDAATDVRNQWHAHLAATTTEPR